MKQLKFMLAAATAISLATAAQADVNTYLVGTGADAKENFNDAELGAAATSLTGYSYAGATAADNESVVVANGYNGSQSLQVNTGTDPIVRDMNADLGTDIDMTAEGFKSLTIDTMVQFTVTPAGDTVTPGATDKLMIYLAEVTNETGVVTGTNLMVKALRFQPESAPGVGDGLATPVTINTGINTIEPGEWYRLVVSSSATDLGDGTYLPVFTIKVGETDVTSGDVSLATDGNYTKFPSLQGAVETPALRYVGFAGEGMVDDLLVFRTDEGETSVDFTLALGTGVSAVTWTIDGVAQTDTLTGKVTAGQTIAITGVTYADWYGPTGTYVKDWSGVWGTDVTADITVEAKELTTAADVGVTVPEGTAPATVNEALAWAKAAGKSTTDVKGASNLVANYLLNVADLTVEPQIEIVSIDASTKPMTITAKVTDAKGTAYEKVLTEEGENKINASIKYRAAATLEALKSAALKDDIADTDQFVQVVVE